VTFPSPKSLGISKRKRYLVGVSGGRDSIALLHWMRFEVGCNNLIVCHLNHSLRGRESGMDAKFVRNIARSYGYEFECEKVDVMKLSKSQKISIEMAARKARFNFFGSISSKWRCSRVVLAHHSDDNVETILMNLFRGSGKLSGIKEKSLISTDTKKLNIYRPLLQVTGEDLDRYVKHNNLRYREDSSNAKNDYLRNRTRNKVIPFLNQIYKRDISKTVLRASNLASIESEFIDEILLESNFSWALEPKLSVSKLRDTNKALQSRIILNWLRRLSVPDVGNAEVDLVKTLLNKEGPAKINLPRGKYVRRRNKLIFLDE